MDLDSLYLLVSEAILKAEALTDLGAPGASVASIDVSLLEERIAELVPAGTAEGAVARRGAVRAAIAANERRRAGALVERFSREADMGDQLRDELRDILRETADAVAQRHRELEARYPWAAGRYGIESLARVNDALVHQAEPLPIG